MDPVPTPPWGDPHTGKELHLPSLVLEPDWNRSDSPYTGPFFSSSFLFPFCACGPGLSVQVSRRLAFFLMSFFSFFLFFFLADWFSTYRWCWCIWACRNLGSLRYTEGSSFPVAGNFFFLGTLFPGSIFSLLLAFLFCFLWIFFFMLNFLGVVICIVWWIRKRGDIERLFFVPFPFLFSFFFDSVSYSLLLLSLQHFLLHCTYINFLLVWGGNDSMSIVLAR